MQAPEFQDTQADEPAPARSPQVELLIDLFRAALGAAGGACHIFSDAMEGEAREPGAARSLLVTGPTHTNINDFRAVLVEAA